MGWDDMNPTMKPEAPAIEYQFNHAPADATCPVCGRELHAHVGTWPFLAGTHTPVCGREDCPVGEDVTGAPPCDTVFEFCEFDSATTAALRGTPEDAGVAERFRLVSLREEVPAGDRDRLQRASIDLLFWEADETRIERFEPRLRLRTCSQAAAEMLLSGCGDIIE
jgi:hypothetical protein